MIYLAADHRGFKLKEELKKYLAGDGYKTEDVGALEYDPADDYVDFARAACEKISENLAANKGIFICGSGHGMDIAANKYKGIRAALCLNSRTAAQSREHEDANVLVLPSDWIDSDETKNIVKTWLEKKFGGEVRHAGRLDKISEIERKNFK